MKNIALLICSVILISCSGIQQNENPRIQLELLEKYPLPPIPLDINRDYFKISALMFINEDGTVRDANLMRPSGDSSWDKKAVDALKRWRYSPPVKNNIPGRIWLRQDIRIEVGEPYYISISKILCESLEIAAEVYQALKNGEDFGDLASKYSIDPTRDQGGKVGKTDIHLYPEYVQRELKRLEADEFSQPISFGDKYLILKRHGN